MPPKKKKHLKKKLEREPPKPLIIDEGLEQQELEFDGRKALRHKPSVSMGGFHSGVARDALPSSVALMQWYNEPLKKKKRGTYCYRRYMWPWYYKPRRDRKLMKQFGFVPSEAEIERIEAGCVKGKTPLLKMMRFVGINEQQAARFMGLFEKVDKDHSGKIDVEEFFGYFKMPVTDFARASFKVMDFEKSESGEGDGELSYAEFFASLYNYASLTDTSLLKFTFDVIDADGSGEVSKSELFDMVRMMYMDKSGKEVQRTVSQLMNVLDADHDGDITFAEFQRAHRKVGTLIYPAFQMQRQLRSRCLTLKFWKAAEKRRNKIEVAGGCSVIDLYRGIVAMEESDDEDAKTNDDDSDSGDSFMSLDDDDLDHIDAMREQVRHAPVGGR